MSRINITPCLPLLTKPQASTMRKLMLMFPEFISKEKAVRVSGTKESYMCCLFPSESAKTNACPGRLLLFLASLLEDKEQILWTMITESYFYLSLSLSRQSSLCGMVGVCSCRLMWPNQLPTLPYHQAQ